METYTFDLAVAITTFKRRDLLKVLLDSFQFQTIPPRVIFVVDNENSSETKKLVESYPSTHYIPMEENTGGAGGFSRGIHEAYRSGNEWIWVMDDDVTLLPGAIENLSKWAGQTEEGFAAGKSLAEVPTVYQGLRRNFDGTFFYWQYHFLNKLGIPNPIASSRFGEDEASRPMNTICFEGGLFHRSIVEKIGLPDARFFIYWDDTVYGYLASKHTQMLLVPDYILQRTRSLENVQIGKVRKLNSTSDMARYHIMRNRGHMAHYLRCNGDFNRFAFGFGTFLTFCKEVIRLFVSKDVKTGFPRLIQGHRESRKILKDEGWQPYSEINPLDG